MGFIKLIAMSLEDLQPKLHGMSLFCHEQTKFAQLLLVLALYQGC